MSATSCPLCASTPSQSRCNPSSVCARRCLRSCRHRVGEPCRAPLSRMPQFCIAVRRVLLGHLSQGQDRCPSLQFHTGGRGFDSPLVRPSGLDRSAHCAASATSLVRAPTLKPHPRPSTAPALTVCSLRSRLAGCSSSPPWTTTILSSLGISGAICTHLPPHRLRADASVRTESARRVDFARVDGRVRGARVGTRTGSG